MLPKAAELRLKCQCEDGELRDRMNFGGLSSVRSCLRTGGTLSKLRGMLLVFIR